MVVVSCAVGYADSLTGGLRTRPVVYLTRWLVVRDLGRYAACIEFSYHLAPSLSRWSSGVIISRQTGQQAPMPTCLSTAAVLEFLEHRDCPVVSRYGVAVRR